ncbi:MAG: DUF192 domain-containing protein [Armatimonadota bacterium]
MHIVNERTGRVLAEKFVIARTLISKSIGLMFSSQLPAKSALVIPGCRQVHTLFVRFPIDVIFISTDCCVVGIVEYLRPFRVSPYCREAATVIELPAGTVSRTGVMIGDILPLAIDQT